MKKLCLLSVLFMSILCQSDLTHPAGAVTIIEYENMFHEILENLRTNYWSPDGNWLGDWMYDAMALAPKALYPYGIDMGDMDLINKANITVDRNIDLLFELLRGGSTDFVEGLMGTYCTLEALQFYSGEQYGNLPFEFAAWLTGVFTQGLIQEVPNPAGDFLGYPFVMGSYAYSAIEYGSIVKGFFGFTATWVALSIIETANKNYWVEDSFIDVDYGYYWDNDPDHLWNEPMNSFVNGPMLMALARAYGVTHDDEHLNKADALVRGANTRLWDQDRGGYAIHLDRPGRKLLADNNSFILALVELYNVTGQVTYLGRAREILDFIENDLFMEDQDHPGYFICSHDWDNGYTNPSFCTGCNFAQLYSIYRLNQLVQNGPIHPDLIGVCGQLPCDRTRVEDCLIYTGILLTPFLSIIWFGRRIRSKEACEENTCQCMC